MSLARLFAAAVAALVLSACATSAPHEAATRPVTILVSIDGFKPEYLDRGVTPTLNALADGGVRGAMRPSFPSKTFPNHYTIVTGLRPDHHGMVDNNMEDPQIPGVRFKLANKDATSDARWWDDGTPIWVTAEKAGIRTATMFWPGSEAQIQGVRPSHWAPYDERLTSAARVDQLLAWLSGPDHPRFGTLYIDEVDTAGHDFGPGSPRVTRAAADADAALSRLRAGLKARGIVANLIIVSDHGMAGTSPERRVWLDDLMPTDFVRTMTMGAFMSAYPAAGHEAEVDKALIRPHEHMQCWRKAEIPARYQYGHHRRVPPYFCLMQTGWEITTRAYAAKQKPEDIDYGNHGYEPADPEMRAVFIANGPAFRSGVRPAVFDNVDVYPLLARLIGVRPLPNDGRFGDVAGVLR